MLYYKSKAKLIKQKEVKTMSCPNFETQENFKLFLWDFERPTDEYLNENILEIDEVITHTKEFMLNENKQYILSRTKIPEKTFNEWMENKVTKYFTTDEVFHYGIATKYLENI